MRHGEIDKLLWAHVGKERIKVLGTKTNKTRYVPVTPVIAEILAARKATKSRYVFTAGGNTPPHFYRILGDACKAVGVPYGEERNGIRMHDCRHTATTDLLQAGIDLSTVQAITGHSDKTMILYYSHPTGESLERAARGSEQGCGSESGLTWTLFGQKIGGTMGIAKEFEKVSAVGGAGGRTSLLFLLGRIKPHDQENSQIPVGILSRQTRPLLSDVDTKRTR